MLGLREPGSWGVSEGLGWVLWGWEGLRGDETDHCSIFLIRFWLCFEISCRDGLGRFGLGVGRYVRRDGLIGIEAESIFLRQSFDASCGEGMVSYSFVR